MSRPNLTNHNYSVRPSVLALAFLGSLALALIQTPTALMEINESEQLTRSLSKITGYVWSHGCKASAKSCVPTVTIKYLVDGRSYLVVAEGYGADPSILPIGKPVEVNYLRNSPSIAQVVLLNARVSRFTWLTLSGLWFLVCILMLITYRSYKQYLVKKADGI